MTATETEKVDISKELRALVERLGLKYENLAELVVTPNRVTADVLLENEEGSKYITADEAVASESQVFDVTT